MHEEHQGSTGIPAALAARAARMGTAVLCNAHDCVQSFSPERSLGARPVAGAALTAASPPSDNAAVHRAIHDACADTFLVVDGGNERTLALFGGLLANCCIHKGIVGAAIYGSIRDSQEIADLGLPVWFCSTNPAPATKLLNGKVNLPIVIQGVTIGPGDLVVADRDGIVVIPIELVDQVIRRGFAVERRERQIRRRLERGATTYQVFNMDELDG